VRGFDARDLDRWLTTDPSQYDEIPECDDREEDDDAA
jgi:hypothetical protein